MSAVTPKKCRPKAKANSAAEERGVVMEEGGALWHLPLRGLLGLPSATFAGEAGPRTGMPLRSLAG